MEQSNPLRLAGIYNGVAGSLLGQVPYGVLTFGSYEMYKRNLIERFPSARPILLYALAAIMGDLTGSGWLCPSEVVKQQLQAGMYPTTAAAVSGIWNKRGLVGFYEGYLGGVARDVPFRVAQLTSYEATKSLYLRIKARRRLQNHPTKATRGAPSKQPEVLQLSSAEAALCGAVSGTISAAVTAPLDRIKTLLMTNSAANGGSVAACAAKIFREEGLRGFAQGIVPRVIYIAPSVVIFFVVYEDVQQRLSHWSSSN
jgi:solute carrier family 25 (mitochondrial S-adenosylmethionine transporter), member 26